LLSIGNINNYLKVTKDSEGVIIVDLTNLEKRLEGLDSLIETKEIYSDMFEVKLVGNRRYSKNID
jgi:hypothetical protein